jgi:hypothetical protein
VNVSSCVFEFRTCQYVAEQLGVLIQMNLTNNQGYAIDLNLSHMLVNNTVECQLNMMVHVDTTIRDKDQRLEIGLPAFTRSQYTVFDYDNFQIGFGGVYNAPLPDPKPIDNGGGGGLGAGMIILIIFIVIAVIGLGYFGFRKYQEKQLVSRLVDLD